MKKNKLIIFAALLLLVVVFQFSSFVSAEVVCCPETNDGALCQNVDRSECLPGSTVASTSCETSAFCRPGTCVNENTGICSSNTAKSVCENAGGIWEDKTIGEIEQCKPGCCVIGSNVAFVSDAECANLATDYGVDVNFRSDINDELSCLSLSSSEEKGACVVSSGGSDRCTIESKADCLVREGAFYNGLLCTAPGLSDCAKSSDKTCFGDDIYFKDTCGNLANMYDSSMYSETGSYTQEMNNYWTEIKTDYSDVDYDGDCDYNSGTTCEVSGGIYSCRSLACDNVEINGRSVTKKHGEGWCVESPGTVPHILVDPITAEFVDPRQREEIENGFGEYNTPGSRYYEAHCWEGEIIVEPCADYRVEVCKEALIGEREDFTVADCTINGWRFCLEITDKRSCDEAYVDCKWVPGYRFDGVNLNEEVSIRENEQGSCVPLYAPGFDFWEPESTASAVCELGSVTSRAFYITSWMENRGKIPKSLGFASENCDENCDAIPGYRTGVGISYFSGLNIDSEDAINPSFSKKGIFRTNAAWLWAVTARGKSLGDCGYKTAINGATSGDSSEVITALFQKLSQKEKPKSSYEKKRPILIYARDDWTGIDPRTTGTGEDYSDIEDDILQNVDGSTGE